MSQHKQFKALAPRIHTTTSRAMVRKDLTGTVIQDREPCTYCAVRADIGCAHQPPSQPVTL